MNNFTNYDNNPTEEFAGRHDSQDDISGETFSGEAFTGDSGYVSPASASHTDDDFEQGEEVIPKVKSRAHNVVDRAYGSEADASGEGGQGESRAGGGQKYYGHQDGDRDSDYRGDSGYDDRDYEDQGADDMNYDNGAYNGESGRGGNYSGDYRQSWDQYRNGGNPPKMKRKSRKGLLIFILVLVIVAGALLGAYILNQFVFHKNVASAPVIESDHLAQVNISGTIDESSSSELEELYSGSTYNHSFIMSTIEELEDESSCKGIILYLNTPGGSVYATDQVYLKLLEYKEKTGNPVYAVMGPQCCSGGYYIACAAGKIFANRNTTTGSIGVTFGTQLDISGLLEKYGVEANTITSGANKSMGSMYEPMTEEQRAIYQSIIDEAYNQFTSIVATGRNMTSDQVLPLADGRIYTATQAMNCGLIDQVCTYDEAIALIEKEAGVEDVYTYAYTSSVSLKDIVLGLATKLGLSSDSENSDLAKAIALAEEASYNEPYYIVNK